MLFLAMNTMKRTKRTTMSNTTQICTDIHNDESAINRRLLFCISVDFCCFSTEQ